MTQSLPFQFNLSLSAMPACGKNALAAGASTPPPGAAPGLDDLPLEETEALARRILEWIEGIEAAARANAGIPWSHQFIGSGDTDLDCQDDAVAQLYGALDPLCQSLAHPNLLGQPVEVSQPQSDVWIPVSVLIHLIVSLFRDDQGRLATWEVAFASPSSGQVWIAVSVALVIRVQPA